MTVVKVTIDFSLFSSPAKAYGTVIGNITVPATFRVGDEVVVLPPKEGDWFTGRLKVIFENRKSDDKGIVISLDDLVARSREDAVRLAARLEDEAGLFCDVYD